MTHPVSKSRLPRVLFLTSAAPFLACLALPAASATPTLLPYPEGSIVSVQETSANRTIIGNADVKASESASGSSTGLVWKNGAYEALTLEGFQDSVLLAINDADVIVGVVYGGENPYAEPAIWANGTGSLLPTLGTGGAAYAINETGDVVGVVFSETENAAKTLPAIWKSGELSILPTGNYKFVQPTSIDDTGVIYGVARMVAEEGESDVPVTWIDGEISALPVTFGKDYVGGVWIRGSEAGFAGGNIREYDALDPAKTNDIAIAWESGVFRQLELTAGQVSSSVGDVNRLGQYAGWFGNDKGETTPVIWSENGPNPLPEPEGRNMIATSLNDTGFVVGMDNTNPDAPVPVFWDLSGEVAMDLPDVTAAAGQTVALRASATRRGAPLANQKVSFAVGGQDVGQAITNGKGVATLGYRVPMKSAGTIATSAKAVGARQAGSPPAVRNLIIGKSPSVASVTPAAGRVGQRVKLTANLALSLQNTALAGKRLSFFVNGTNVGRATTDKNGVARTSIVIPAGTPRGDTIPVEVRYAGDGTSRGTVGRASIYLLP